MRLNLSTEKLQDIVICPWIPIWLVVMGASRFKGPRKLCFSSNSGPSYGMAFSSLFWETCSTSILCCHDLLPTLRWKTIDLRLPFNSLRSYGTIFLSPQITRVYGSWIGLDALSCKNRKLCISLKWLEQLRKHNISHNKSPWVGIFQGWSTQSPVTSTKTTFTVWAHPWGS